MSLRNYLYVVLVLASISSKAQVNTDASGNVVIGANPPRGAFDVKRSGDVYLTSDPNDGAALSTFLSGHVYLAPYDASGISYLQARRQNNLGSTSLRLRTLNAGSIVDAMHLSSNGNVGIGVLNPLHRLHIEGSMRMGAMANAPLFVGQGDHLIVGGSVIDLALRSELGHILFGGGGLERMRMTNSGSFGIGTANPESRLHVNGGEFRVTPNASSMDAGLLMRVVDSESYEIRTGSSNNFTFPKKLLLNLNGGGVGIGTIDIGTNKLAVEGTIAARKVKVTQVNPWPDYVFDPSYQLPSLSEVEVFIKQHKHLPDVPSARDVEQNGLDLGDNQATLLKKIEELTLYAIDADKKQQAQASQLQAQMELIRELQRELAAIKKSASLNP